MNRKELEQSKEMGLQILFMLIGWMVFSMMTQNSWIPIFGGVVGGLVGKLIFVISRRK